MSLKRVGVGTCQIAIFCAFFSSISHSAPLPSRLTARIDDSQIFELKGSVPHSVLGGLARDQGPVPRSQPMPRLSLHFSLTAAQRADLAQLLETQQDRRSPQYHQFLTPEEYAARFGLTNTDIEKVTRWLENSGFHHLQVARSRTWISFSGTVGQAETAFHTSIHRYELKGELHLANTADARLPKALEGLVEGVRGLNDMRLRPAIRRLNPQFTSSISGSHYLAPDDWATIYDVKPLYSAGLDGTGVTIAIVGQSDVHLAPLQAFRTAAGFPANTPTIVIPPGDPDPGFVTGEDESESYLDLEWAGGIAKNASILFITSGNGVDSSMLYAIDNNVAPIVSESYGQCEPEETTSDFNTQTALLQQANAQGMTIVASSGDAGAAACDQGVTESAATLGLAVNFPASSPYVTGIGGTDFNEGGGNYWSTTNNSSNGSALSYIPEVVWNDAFQSASGGGASILVTTKPTWQTGAGVPADGVRDVPDIAFAASPNHDGYLICEDGGCTNGFRNSVNNLDVIGGTSAGTPSFAGLLALVIRQHGTGTRLGNINPNLYSLAQISPNVFHDVTSGNNEQVCATSTPNCPTSGGQIGFSAGTGYDQTTGWGSVDGYNFAQQWYGDFQIAASPTTLTIQPGASATTTVNITPQNNFSGNVTFACSVSSNLIGVTCSVPSASVGPSGSAVVTISASANARTVPRVVWPRPLSNWPLLVLTLTPVLWAAFRKRRDLRVRPVFAAGAASLVLAAFGAVSCGGGGSTTTVPTSGPPAALTLSCTAPPVATVGTAFSADICTAHGGTAPLNYSVGVGPLPPGLSMNTITGVISGTPTTAGSYPIQVEVIDSALPSPQSVGSQVETIYVGSATPVPLNVSCTLPTAFSGSYYYHASCTATGGQPAYTFSVSAGALPAGLSFSSSGQFSGIPLTAGTSTFTISAVDSGPSVGLPQSTGSVTYSNFVVQPGALSVYCSGPIQALVSLAFNYTCSASAGTLPYSYSISSGTLPPGLALNPATGIISGTPTTTGSYTFLVKATDGGSPPQTATQSVFIPVEPYQPLSLQCILAAAQAGAQYNGGSCIGFGGTTPYSFALSANAPSGLTIDRYGNLGGIPSQPGTFTFSALITDSEVPPVTASQSVTLVVTPRASETGTVTVTATSGGIVNTATITVTVP